MPRWEVLKWPVPFRAPWVLSPSSGRTEQGELGREEEGGSTARICPGLCLGKTQL